MNRFAPFLWMLAAAAAGPALVAGGETNPPSGPVVTVYTTGTVQTNLPAEVILGRALANRPMKDLALKARLFVTREQVVPVELLVRNTPTETRTIYRGGQTDLLVVQPVHGTAQLYLRGVGQLNETQRLGLLLGSQFTYYDISFPFLHWPQLQLQGEDRVRGRECYLVEARATNAPYALVKLWIDKTYFGLVRAEAYDADSVLLKRFAVTSLKRIGDIWIPRGMEAARVPAGQSMPAEDRSRLEILDGNYDAHLPAAAFSPEQFGVATAKK